MPSPGQSWSDLYPDGAPPVFPLPGSSRALGSPQAAATAFAQDMLGMETADLAVDSQDGERAVLTLQGSPANTHLELRRGELGWEVVAATAEGLDVAVAGSSGADGPTGVDRTIDVTGAPGAPAGTTVDVVDLADGRLVVRQPLAGLPAPAAGPTTLTLPDPLPQLAAVIFYVPDDSAPGHRRRRAAGPARPACPPIHVQALNRSDLEGLTIGAPPAHRRRTSGRPPG